MWQEPHPKQLNFGILGSRLALKCSKILNYLLDQLLYQKILTFGCRDSRMLSGTMRVQKLQNLPYRVLGNHHFRTRNPPRVNRRSVLCTNEIPTSQRDYPTAATSSKTRSARTEPEITYIIHLTHCLHADHHEIPIERFLDLEHQVWTIQVRTHAVRNSNRHFTVLSTCNMHGFI